MHYVYIKMAISVYIIYMQYMGIYNVFTCLILPPNLVPVNKKA